MNRWNNHQTAKRAVAMQSAPSLEITLETETVINAANVTVSADSPAAALDKALNTLDRAALDTGKVAAIDNYRVTREGDNEYVVRFY